jgi:hypothetical protein
VPAQIWLELSSASSSPGSRPISLSDRFAAAATEAQRSVSLAAGQALLASRCAAAIAARVDLPGDSVLLVCCRAARRSSATCRAPGWVSTVGGGCALPHVPAGRYGRSAHGRVLLGEEPDAELVLAEIGRPGEPIGASSGPPSHGMRSPPSVDRPGFAKIAFGLRIDPSDWIARGDGGPSAHALAVTPHRHPANLVAPP